MKPFLRWWLCFVLILLGSGAAWYTGVFAQAARSDITKLSFLIYGLFMIESVRTGVLTYRKNASVRVGVFIGNALMSLGIIGTVIGLIYTLSMSFSTLDPSNEMQMREALSSISLGMSTALFTTAAGLICSLLLRVQLFNLRVSHGK